MRAISTDSAPQPAGHYSQAIVHNGLAYVSGQLAIDPETGEKKLGSIEDEARQTLSNLDQVLRAAGSGLEHVLKMTVYISDIELWGRFNAIYAEVFGEHRPARSVVPTRDLHFGFKVEIDAIAAVSKE